MLHSNAQLPAVWLRRSAQKPRSPFLHLLPIPGPGFSLPHLEAFRVTGSVTGQSECRIVTRGGSCPRHSLPEGVVPRVCSLQGDSGRGRPRGGVEEDPRGQEPEQAVTGGGDGGKRVAAVGSGVVALVAVGGDVSSPGSHRCCRDRGGQCKWRGSGQGGGHVPGGEQDLLLPSPALPVDWTLPCREKAWAPQGGCAPRAAWPHCPQQSCLPCDPRRGLPARCLPARCHWPGEEQTGPPGSPAPP